MLARSCRGGDSGGRSGRRFKGFEEVQCALQLGAGAGAAPPLLRCHQLHHLRAQGGEQAPELGNGAL